MTDLVIATAAALLVGLFFFVGYSRGARSCRALVTELTANLEEQIERVRQLQQQRTRLDQSIAGLAEQRNEWRDQYHVQSVQHGNAQSLLYDELLRLRAQARRQGVELRLRPVVEAAVHDFHDQHVIPSSSTRPDIKTRPLPKPEDHESDQ